MISTPDCTDWVYQAIEGTGLGERVRAEIFQSHGKPGYYGGDSSRELRKLGKRSARLLGIREPPNGFESLAGFYLGLGAYIAGEYLHSMDFRGVRAWRSGGKKTDVWNMQGDAVLVTQKLTDRDCLYVPEWDERSVHLNWGSWPEFLGIALQYLSRVKPGVDMRAFASEHFQAWRNPFEKALFAESLTDEEVVRLFVPPPGTEMEPTSAPRQRKRGERTQESRLGDSGVYYLQDLFRQQVPEVREGVAEPHQVFGCERAYFLYVSEGRLTFGVRVGSERAWEDVWTPSRRVEVRTPRGAVAIRDWVWFDPPEAETLVRACFDQYARDRAQVPEIIDLYTWGTALDAPAKEPPATPPIAP